MEVVIPDRRASADHHLNLTATANTLYPQPEFAASVYHEGSAHLQLGGHMSQGILIADDSLNVRRALHNYLAERNFDICGEAVDGEDVIEKARQLKPDLILMDLAMPGQNGITAASVLKDMMPNVPIVLFTMHSEAVNKAFTSLKNVDAMVDKSQGMGKLAECVQNLLGSADTLGD